MWRKCKLFKADLLQRRVSWVPVKAGVWRIPVQYNIGEFFIIRTEIRLMIIKEREIAMAEANIMEGIVQAKKDLLVDDRTVKIKKTVGGNLAEKFEFMI